MKEIYPIKKAIDRLANRIKADSHLSDNNKKEIFRFYRFCIASNISLARTLRYMYVLRDCGGWLAKDFVSCDKDDIIELITKIELMDKYNPRTKMEYKASIKRFFKWLRNSDNPPEVDWIKVNLKKNNEKLPSDLLTEEEVIRLVDSAKSIRDKAVIMSLYESGCRIGEFIKMKIRDIEFQKPGCFFTISGKTGARRIRLISSEKYILDWLNSREDGDNRDSYLWCNHNFTDMISYPALTKLIRVASQRANITKKVNPHNFRHSRATYLAGKITEQQLKMFFGWTKGSDMAAVYVHLSGRDMDDAILNVYGIENPQSKSKSSLLSPIICPKCKESNIPTSKFCNSCSCVLNQSIADEIITKDVENTKYNELMSEMLRDKEFMDMFIKKAKDKKLII